MRSNLTLLCFVLLVMTSGIASAQKQGVAMLRYVDAKQATHAAQIIDTRALAACQQRSLAGAHCLPASDLIGPDGELPSFADIYWALGTAGISPHKPVLVVGNQARARDFVAGLLYLCGQASVQILTTPIDDVLQQKQWPVAPGQARGILRHTVYAATMRDALIVLPAELAQALAEHHPVVPVDGRNLATHNVDEYQVGHIPGAVQLAPAQGSTSSNTLRLPSVNAQTTTTQTTTTHARQRYYVAYAQRPMDSIAFFTRLRAGEADPHVDIRVMPAGWQGWILHQHNINPVADTTVSGADRLISFIGSREKGEEQWN